MGSGTTFFPLSNHSPSDEQPARFPEASNLWKYVYSAQTANAQYACHTQCLKTRALREKLLSRHSSTALGMGPNPIRDGDGSACPTAHLSRTFPSSGIDCYTSSKSANHAREAVGEHVKCPGPPPEKTDFFFFFWKE